MRKFILLTIMITFLNITASYAKDIIPIKHNEFGETVIAVDLDSVKLDKNDTYSIEVLYFTPDEDWPLKDQLRIFKYEININKKQYRLIEYYTRLRKNWKISVTLINNSKLEEDGQTKWKNIEPDTPFEQIYSITCIVGIKGKKYYIEHLFNNN